MTKARDLANASTALSAVSATELAYVDGVTSAIQTQIDGKQAVNANVSTTELGYLDGVTSAIQTQLDAKTAKSTLTTTGDIYYASAANTPARLGIGSSAQVLTVASGVPSWATPSASASGLTLITTQTVSDVASITFDNVFTSTYLNYLITYTGVRSTFGVSVDLLFQFRYAGPTTQTSHTYGINGVTSGGTAINVGAAAQTAAIISRNLGDSTYLIRGQMFVGQVGNSNQLGAANGQTMDPYGEEFINYGFYGSGTARTYTGFLISASSGNLTGTFTVYGLAKS
jgi:hypothetical protein